MTAVMGVDKTGLLLWPVLRIRDAAWIIKHFYEERWLVEWLHVYEL